MDLEWHLVARLLVAAGLGAAIGLEREIADQPAGLRTHIAVAVGAALFGVVSVAGFLEFEATTSASNVRIDVTRVASLVASGIGFIGAGLIFRQGTSVRNLTTAASVWVTAAIGLACGVGDFGPAVAAVVITLVALVVLRVPRGWVRAHVRPDRAGVRIELHHGVPVDPVIDALRRVDGLEVRAVAVEKRDGAFVLLADVAAAPGFDVGERLGAVARDEAVRTLVVGVGPND